MIYVNKIGIISSMWAHCAYDSTTEKFVGYFSCDDRSIVDEHDKVLHGPNEFEVVSLNEKAWE